jgi:predicted Rossmann fold nucleotide-binding protein DprA/Smf involved in DNA uptake
MSASTRDVREVIREEPAMRDRILALLREAPKTVPEIASALGCPSHEVLFWVMAMRRYGWLSEVRDSAADGFFRYERTGRAS